MRLQTLTLFLSILFTLTSCLQAPDNSGGRERNDDNGDNTQEQNPDDIKEDLSQYLRSQITRNRSTSQFSISGMRKSVTANGNYPNNILIIPHTKENADMDTESTKYSSRNENCGILPNDNAPSIKKRIADCNEVYKDDLAGHKWIGKVNGIAGEGNWQLVIKKSNRHIWIDLSTNLIWTDLIKTTDWEHASGRQVNPVDATCTNEALAEEVSSGNTDYFMGLTADEVSLRLPTRNDFLQADINGARFVLSNLANKTYWTANYNSTESKAWAISQVDGILSKVNPATNLSVRCVGIIIK